MTTNSTSDLLSRLESLFPSLKEEKVKREEMERESEPLMLATDLNSAELLPYYLRYCLETPETDYCVAYGTLNAIAEYGRCKDPDFGYLNAIHCYSTPQKKFIVDFIYWYAKQYYAEDNEQLQRTLKRWIKAL